MFFQWRIAKKISFSTSWYMRQNDHIALAQQSRS